MKNIPLSEAFDLIEDASAVIVDGNAVTYANLDDIHDDPENQFLYVSWSDEHSEFYHRFAEGENQSVEVSGTEMHLVDSDGDTICLQLLYPKSLE